MDFSTLDYRSAAEEGFFYELKNVFTGEPLGDGFWLRGAIAPTSQRRLSKLFSETVKKTKQTAESEQDGSEQTEPANEDVDFETMYQGTIDTAMAYIIRASDEMTWMGQPVGSNEELIHAVLNTTYPQYKKNDEGRLEPTTTPYANQIVEAAEEYQAFLEKPQNS
jgi:hypothetical protein